MSRIVPIAPLSAKARDFNVERVKAKQNKDILWAQVIYASASRYECILPELPIPLSHLELED